MDLGPSPTDASLRPRVLVDGHLLGRGETGNERYLRGLLDGFRRIGMTVDLAVEQAADVPAGHHAVALSGRSDVARLGWRLGRLASSRGADVVHSTYFPPLQTRAARVVTVHDVSFATHPQWFTPRDRAVLRLALATTARRAARVIVPSRHAQDALAEAAPRLQQRTVVVSEGVDPLFSAGATAGEAAVDDGDEQRVTQADGSGARGDVEVLRRLGIVKPYVLFVGNLQPRKNLGTLLEAWARLRAAGEHDELRLVLAGGTHGRRENVAERIRRHALADSVVLTGYVDDADLPPLYRGARLFVFPSLCEGFGLPVLEAMACGTPVACSSTTALPEVAGSAAALFDPTDADEMAAVIGATASDPDLRAALRERGLARARAFSWHDAARATLDVYREALEEVAS